MAYNFTLVNSMFSRDPLHGLPVIKCKEVKTMKPKNNNLLFLSFLFYNQLLKPLTKLA